MTVTIVSKSNFVSLLPSILHHIKEADFIAFDTELTGLTSSSATRYFYYDDIDERYKKLRDSATNFGILQFGLSAWKLSTGHGKSAGGHERFTSTNWSFHLFPATSSAAGDYRRWMLQLGSIAFLRDHGFDFNKTFLDGISYLSRKEEEEWRVKQDNLLSNRRVDKEISLGEEDILFLDETSAMVQQWIDSLNREEGGEGDSSSAHATDHHPSSTIPLATTAAATTLELPPCNSFQRLLLYQNLPKVFGENLLITKGEAMGSLRLQMTTAEERQRAGEEAKAELERTLRETIGFRRVVDYIHSQGKTLVGHNCWLDLCHTWGKFIGPLPGEWNEFQQGLPEHLGSCLYDTKLIANQLITRKVLNLNASSSDGGEIVPTTERSTSLEQLAMAVDDPNRWGVRVRVDGGKTKKGASSKGGGAFHDAGFDAHCTGKVFIGLATLLAKEHGVEAGQMIRFLTANARADERSPSSSSLGSLINNETLQGERRSLMNRLFMMTSDYDAYGVRVGQKLSEGETTPLVVQEHPDRSLIHVLADLTPSTNAALVNEALIRAGLERNTFAQHWMDPRTVLIELRQRRKGDDPDRRTRPMEPNGSMVSLPSRIALKDKDDRIMTLALIPYAEWRLQQCSKERVDSPSMIKRLRISSAHE